MCVRMLMRMMAVDGLRPHRLLLSQLLLLLLLCLLLCLLLGMCMRLGHLGLCGGRHRRSGCGCGGGGDGGGWRRFSVKVIGFQSFALFA